MPCSGAAHTHRRKQTKAADVAVNCFLAAGTKSWDKSGGDCTMLEAMGYLYGACGSPEGPVHALTVLRVQKAILVRFLAPALSSLLSSLQDRLKAQGKIGR